MSFTVTLQTNNSEENRLVKSVTDVLSVTGTLKANCSIIDPVILIEMGSVPANVNYMTISEFGRSYFVRDMISVRNGLWEIHAHVDALSSFAGQIAGCTGIVRRQENDWNLYLNDGVFRTYVQPMIVSRSFPSGFNSAATYILVTV